MKRRAWFLGAAGVVAVLALGYAGWRTVASADADQCYACTRPVHAHSKTLALVDGRSRRFCCPACALSQHEQTGKPVRITQLTSFLTGQALAPDSAYLVRGSNVNPCEKMQKLIDADKRPADLRYDRCAPSLIAFAGRDEAMQFTREHGGEVESFHEVAAAFATARQ
jgi:hypothetical protein